MPYDLRLKQIDKYQTKSQQKSKSNQPQNQLQNNEISVGSLVCLKSLPLYNIGTIGITVKDGQPRIGQLNEHVFSYRDNKFYKFKIKSLENISKFLLNQSQSINTSNQQQQQQQQIVQIQPVQGSLKRKKLYSHSYQSNDQISQSSPSSKTKLNDQTCLNKDKQEEQQVQDKKEEEDNKEIEESWLLSEVFFLEETKSSNVLGKVIKIDSDYVLVKMNSLNETTTTATNTTQTAQNQQDILDSTRIFQKNQLQLVLNQSTNSNKSFDFIQKSPKKLSDISNVLTICAQQNSIHAILNKDNNLVYVQYDMLTNKSIKEKRFPTNFHSFLGNNLNNISLRTIDDPNVIF